MHSSFIHLPTLSPLTLIMIMSWAVLLVLTVDQAVRRVHVHSALHHQQLHSALDTAWADSAGADQQSIGSQGSEHSVDLTIIVSASTRPRQTIVVQDLTT